jgi:HAD superfamily hydrolase (TIGR01549 family)
MSIPHNPIHAILFDLDGTLRHDQPRSFETLINYLQQRSHTFHLTQLKRAECWGHYYWTKSPELKADEANFGGRNEAFWIRQTERQIRALGMEGEVAALAQEVSQFFQENYKPVNHVPEDVIPTLTQLRAAGYRLGLVSNRIEPLDAFAAELGLAGLFDFTLSGGQAESYKPDPGIFLKAVALAGCLPETSVYVGDNFYADVVGARAAGLRPVLIDPKEIFPEPGCPVIHLLSELATVL